MTDKEKIRAEVERLKIELNYVPFTDEVLGKRTVLDSMLFFIDSLPEEPVSSTQKYEELLEKTATRLRSIAYRTYHITSGNLSHELACLRGFALRAVEIIDKSLNKD